MPQGANENQSGDNAFDLFWLKWLCSGMKADIKKTFGRSVCFLRKKLDLSQREVSVRSGLHRTYISDVERGERNLSLESIEKLANALEVSIPTLFHPVD